MPPSWKNVAFSALRPRPPLDGDRPAAPHGGHVERVGVRRADVRVAEAAEQHPQHGVGIGDGADGGARVGPHPLLADDDRRRQPVEDVDVRAGLGRHEALDEGAVGLVDHPLRLRGDRGEHQRALARARDPGEHRQPALGQLDADVLEVVLACAVHADQVVAVSGVLHVRSHGHDRTRQPGSGCADGGAIVRSTRPGTSGPGCVQLWHHWSARAVTLEVGNGREREGSLRHPLFPKGLGLRRKALLGVSL